MPEGPTPDQRTAIGRLVKRTREREGLTIQDASKRASVSHMTWINVEAGRSVRSSTYSKVEASLGWESGSLDDFVATGKEPRAVRPGSARRVEPGVMPDVDAILDLDQPDAVKVLLIKATRGEGDPIDEVLNGEGEPSVKVKAIQALRDLLAAQARAVRTAPSPAPEDSKSG